jgi:class 3 adenylate cyclase
VVVSVLLFALVVALWVYVLSFRRAVVFVAGVLVMYYGAVFLLSQLGYLADPVYAPVAIILAATFSLAARYVLEERERRKVERIFGHYVDPRIVLQLAASRSIEDIISKGERRDMTLLFVDIRGFTAMSEGMSAEAVQFVIQEYLDEMSSLILKWDGTIDKYVGDEIVALWNAPVDQPDHALLAIRCAYDLVSQAPVLEARLASKGLPPISWGIGVNSGPAVVGNMGSKDRLQYTALGDTVNTASAAPHRRSTCSSVGPRISRARISSPSTRCPACSSRASRPRRSVCSRSPRSARTRHRHGSRSRLTQRSSPTPSTGRARAEAKSSPLRRGTGLDGATRGGDHLVGSAGIGADRGRRFG